MCLLAGCQTVGFYSQAVGGQLSIMRKQVPIDRLLDDPATPEPLRDQLALTQEILEFAEKTMGLEVGNRYRRYVELGRDYVVWNVVAAPAFSLEPERWCYPFVGCAPYRGYFSESAALAFAASLEADGLETFVGGTPAYSTLGWFDDPVLSSFVDYPPGHLAELLLHELAHGRVWVAGDVAFNEAFASFVGETGASSWLGADDRARFEAANKASKRFERWLHELANSLADVYQSADTNVLPERKQATMARYLACYEAHRSVLGEGRYDQLVEARLNNAYLAARRTYEDWQPAFRALFERSGKHWESFFDAVEALGALTEAERVLELEALREEGIAGERDHSRADEIQCEPLPRHGLGGETPGGKDDDVGRSRNGEHERA